MNFTFAAQTLGRRQKASFFQKQTSLPLVIGENQEQEPIRLNSGAEPHSMMVLGSTGSGKSYFILLLILLILKEKWGRTGLLFMSPSEDVYHWIVLYCSRRPELAKRVVLISPEDFEKDGFVAGYRGLPRDSKNAEYIAYTALQMIFRVHKQNAFDFPRINKWLYNVLYPVIQSGYSLIDCERFMYDKKFRSKLLSQIDNARVLSDWQKFDKFNHIKQEETLEGVFNRFEPFFVSPPVRNILSGMNTFNMAEAMEHGLIVLCNLNDSDPITQEAAAFVGSLLIDDVLRSGRQRNLFDPHLIPFRVIIDEFPVFSGASKAVSASLDQLRKYKVFLAALACQTLSQLQRDDENLFSSVMSGCKSKICFAAHFRDDAKTMAEAMFTGYLDLMKVKDEVYSTRTRLIQELEELEIEAITRDVGVRGQVSKEETESTKNSQVSETGKIVSDTESNESFDAKESSQSSSQESGTSHQEQSGSETFSSQGKEKGGQNVSENSSSEKSAQRKGRGSKQGNQKFEEQRHSQGTSQFTSQSREHGAQDSTEHSQTQTNGTRQVTGSRSGHQTSSDQRTVEPDRGVKQQIQGKGTRSSSEQFASNESSVQQSQTNKTSHMQFEKQTEQQGQRQDQQDVSSHGNRSSSEQHTSFDESNEEATGHREAESQYSKTSQQDGEKTSQGTSQSHHQSETQTQSEKNMNGTRQTSSHTEQNQQSTKTSDSRETGSSEKHSAELSAGWKKTFTKTKTKYNRPEEIQELSRRTFYSVQELWEIAFGDLMNQETGTATLKIGHHAPVKVNISRITPPYFDPKRSPQAIEKFKQLVFENHPQYYNKIQIGDEILDDPATEAQDDNERNEDDGLFNI